MPGSRHILLYGPPAAGKLTVARCLESRYGLRVLDNTATIEVALRLFEFGTTPFNALVHRLRFELAAAAAGAGLDVVSTFVYAHPADREYVDGLVETVGTAGGRVAFVQLLPPPPVLEQRVTESSRAEVHKLRDPGVLRSILERHDLRTPVNPDDLSIDNSDVPPEAVAAMIAAHAGL